MGTSRITMCGMWLPFNSQNQHTACPRAGSVPSLLLLLAAVMVITSCAERYQLTNTTPSIDEIGSTVLAGLYKNDFKGLDAMRITEREFRELIFPGLPIGKIKQWQEQYDFVWGDVNTKSTYGLRAVLARYGGQKFSYVKTIFKKGVTAYETCGRTPFTKQTYRAHEDARIIAKDESGKEVELKLFGAIIEYRGAYKIMSFNIKD